MNKKVTATVFAILAAILYATNIPLSKIFLGHVSPAMMASFLYLGAGIGMIVYGLFSKKLRENIKSAPLAKSDLLYTVLMVLLDIIAPIFLMLGIKHTESANVSLLNNFEIVATSIVALLIFKEAISKKLWLSIFLVTVASIILSFEGKGALSFNHGSLFVILACISWGFENNCTKMLSEKSSEEIVIIKGIFSGTGSLIIAFIVGESLPSFMYILGVLLLGFVAYGLSINFYIRAQKNLGAAKTSAYYSLSPFIGVLLSLVFLGEKPNIQFYAALLIMIVSTVIMTKDTMETVESD